MLSGKLRLFVCADCGMRYSIGIGICECGGHVKANELPVKDFRVEYVDSDKSTKGVATVLITLLPPAKHITMDWSHECKLN